MIDILNTRGDIINEIRQQVENNARNIDVQFTPIAQIQADLNQINRILARLNVA